MTLYRGRHRGADPGPREPGRDHRRQRIGPQQLPRPAKPGRRRPHAAGARADHPGPLRAARTDLGAAALGRPKQPQLARVWHELRDRPRRGDDEADGLQRRRDPPGRDGQRRHRGPGRAERLARFTSGNVKGTIYRYVVWDNQASCPAPAAPCLKRVIVAVALDATASGGPAPTRSCRRRSSTPPPSEPRPGRRAVRTPRRGRSGSPTPPATSPRGSRSPPATRPTTRAPPAATPTRGRAPAATPARPT